MNYIQKIKEYYYERKIYNLIKNSAFDEALEYIKKISSLKKQEKIIIGELVGYALNIKSIREVEITTDKKEYERFKAIVGSSSTVKHVFYRNPETDEIEGGINEIIEEIIPSDNLLLKYLDDINK